MHRIESDGKGKAKGEGKPRVNNGKGIYIKGIENGHDTFNVISFLMLMPGIILTIILLSFVNGNIILDLNYGDSACNGARLCSHKITARV